MKHTKKVISALACALACTSIAEDKGLVAKLDQNHDISDLGIAIDTPIDKYRELTGCIEYAARKYVDYAIENSNEFKSRVNRKPGKDFNEKRNALIKDVASDDIRILNHILSNSQPSNLDKLTDCTIEELKNEDGHYIEYSNPDFRKAVSELVRLKLELFSKALNPELSKNYNSDITGIIQGIDDATALYYAKMKDGIKPAYKFGNLFASAVGKDKITSEFDIQIKAGKESSMALLSLLIKN